MCESVKEWTETRSGAQSRMLLGPRPFVRKLPSTVEPEIDEGFVSRRAGTHRERYLVGIDGAKLVGENGIVVLPDGSYSSESVYGRAQLEADPDYHALTRRPVARKSGSYFSLLVIWSKSWNYYHWLHDTLPRLCGVVETLPPDTRYIVRADLNALQLETLRLLGIDRQQLAFFGGDEIWELETLYFAPFVTNSGNDRREVDEWLRDKFFTAFRLEPTLPTRRILLSRRDTKNRRLVNEHAVESFVRDYGFEIAIPGELSFRQQVELFAQASVVVATHGAGLTNILFAPPGLVVVEMIPSGIMKNSYLYWTMADELSHEYWYLVAESIPPARPWDDARVSLEKIAETFDRLQLSKPS